MTLNELYSTPTSNDFALLSQVPSFSNWKEIQCLHGGFSADKKYRVQTTDGQNLLVRISDFSTYEQKHRQFQLMKKLNEKNLNIPHAIDFSVLDSSHVCTILSWVEGNDAREEIVKLSEQDQIRLGHEAGRILREIHQVPIEQSFNWSEFFTAKIHRKIEKAKASAQSIPKLDRIIEFVETSLPLMKNRKLNIEHGDYHLGNMVIHEGHLGIVDFDRIDIADGYDDFKPFCWNVLVSPLFASALIDGYFEFRIPDDFFPLLALYAAEALLGAITWAAHFGVEQNDIMMDVHIKTLSWFDDFNRVIPSWYVSTSK